MVLIQVRAIGKYRHPLAEQIDEECNQPEALWLNNFRIYLTKVQVARLFETVKDSMSVITLEVTTTEQEKMLQSGSGISAISSVPYAFSEVFPKLTLGTWTYIFQRLLVLTLMILKKRFVPSYLFSFVAGFMFGETGKSKICRGTNGTGRKAFCRVECRGIVWNL